MRRMTMASVNASKNVSKKTQTKPAAKSSTAPATNTRKSHMPTDSQPATSKQTKIIVKFNCGFPNNLYIRGEGIKGLSWDRGILMKCTKADEWIWETDASFSKGKVKVLLNDKQYELGENHDIACGKSVSFQPRF